MRPLLTPEAAAIVRAACAITEASESAAASQLIVAGSRSHEPVPGAGRPHVPGYGGRLRLARRSRGMTQRSLALHLGVSQALISHVERGGLACAVIVAWVEGEG